MSTLKVNTIRHTGASSDAVTLATDGTCTAKITNNLSNRNLIINGDMRVAQRGTSTTTGTGNFGVYTLDRWKASAYATDQLNLTVTQETSSSAVGFNTYLKASPNAAESGGAADEYAHLRYSVEAQDCQQLKWGTSSAESITLSFWVKSNATGVGCINFLKHDATQQQITRTYTINAADTWEKKTVTIPGNTGSGIDNNNGVGIHIYWFLDAGSSYKSSDSTSWQNFADAGYAYGQALNLVDSTSDYLALTGVQLEVGDVATDFEHRSYGDELRRCQRYYWENTQDYYPLQWDSAHRVLQIDHPVWMRATPTETLTAGFGTFVFQNESNKRIAYYTASAYNDGDEDNLTKVVFSAEL